MAIKGLFIPGITEDMFRNASLEGIETLISEGEVYDAELEMMIISEGKLVTARPEVDFEQIKAYCRSRCLSLVSNECFEELRSVKRPEPQWIPCSQKLPEEDKYVLICSEDDPEEEYYCRMAVGWREDGYWNCWDDRADPRMNVIAWMPLPEPYRGEEK